MPLFFILSLMTYTISTNFGILVKKMKKSWNHLIIPTIIIWIVQSIILFFSSNENGVIYLGKSFSSLFWASGVKVELSENYIVPALGMCWFLVVLFESRLIYEVLNLILKGKVFYLACLLLSVVGVLLGQNGVWLPFSLDITLAILLFWYRDKIKKS